jgi:chromosome partitioning protein
VNAHVITVANRKGGTGKTATTVNLAADLAARGSRVLVVDLDAQGHAGLGLGAGGRPVERTVHDLFRIPGFDLESAIRASAVDAVDLIPADRAFDGGAPLRAPGLLAAALGPIVGSYDYVLIDTPPAADAILVNALVASRHVLVPTLLHHLALDGVAQFARTYFRVATSLNHDLRALAIVPTQVDLRMRMQHQVLAELIKTYGGDRIFRAVRTDVSVAEAFGMQMPLGAYRKGTRAYSDYHLLADDVLHFWGNDAGRTIN